MKIIDLSRKCIQFISLKQKTVHKLFSERLFQQSIASPDQRQFNYFWYGYLWISRPLLLRWFMKVGCMELGPIHAAEGKIAAAQVHTRLRQMILDGTVPPGTVLSQVQLAQEIGVSRTPLREALRMLQAEGLVLAEYNHRVRVADIDISELEYFYASRIMLESLAIALTVPCLSQEDIDRLASTLDQMHAASERRDMQN